MSVYEETLRLKLETDNTKLNDFDTTLKQIDSTLTDIQGKRSALSSLLGADVLSENTAFSLDDVLSTYHEMTSVLSDMQSFASAHSGQLGRAYSSMFVTMRQDAARTLDYITQLNTRLEEYSTNVNEKYTRFSSNPRNASKTFSYRNFRMNDDMLNAGLMANLGMRHQAANYQQLRTAQRASGIDLSKIYTQLIAQVEREARVQMASAGARTAKGLASILADEKHSPLSREIKSLLPGQSLKQNQIESALEAMILSSDLTFENFRFNDPKLKFTGVTRKQKHEYSQDDIPAAFRDVFVNYGNHTIPNRSISTGFAARSSMYKEMRQFIEKTKDSYLLRLASEAGFYNERSGKFADELTIDQANLYAALLGRHAANAKSGAPLWARNPLSTLKQNDMTNHAISMMEIMAKQGSTLTPADTPNIREKIQYARTHGGINYNRAVNMEHLTPYPSHYVIPKTYFDSHGQLVFQDPATAEIQNWKSRKNGAAEEKNDPFVLLGDSQLTKLMGYDPLWDNYTFGHGRNRNRNNEAIYGPPRIIKVRTDNLFEPGAYSTTLTESGAKYIRNATEPGATVKYGGKDYSFISMRDGEMLFAETEKYNQIRNDWMQNMGVDPFANFNLSGKLVMEGDEEATQKQINATRRWTTPGTPISLYGKTTPRVLPIDFKSMYKLFNESGMKYNGSVGIDKMDQLDSAMAVMPGLFGGNAQFRAAGPALKGTTVQGDFKAMLLKSGFLAKALADPNNRMVTQDANGRIHFYLPTTAVGQGGEEAYKAMSDFMLGRIHNDKEAERIRDMYFGDVMAADALLPDSAIKNEGQFALLPQEAYLRVAQSAENAGTAFGRAWSGSRNNKNRLFKTLQSEGRLRDGFVHLNTEEYMDYLQRVIDRSGGFYLNKTAKEAQTASVEDVGIPGLFKAYKLPRSIQQTIAPTPELLIRSNQLYDEAFDILRDPSRVFAHDKEALATMKKDPTWLQNEGARKINEMRENLIKERARQTLLVDKQFKEGLASPLLGSIFSFIGQGFLGLNNNGDMGKDLADDVRSLAFPEKMKQRGMLKKDEEAVLAPWFNHTNVLGMRNPDAFGANVILKNLSKVPFIDSMMKSLGMDTDALTLSPRAIYRMNTGDFDGDTVRLYYEFMSGLFDNVKEIDQNMAKAKTMTGDDVKKRETIKQRVFSRVFGKQSKENDQGEQMADAVVNSAMATNVMGQAVQAMQNAMTLPDTDPNKWVALYQAAEWYDKATSEVKNQGMMINAQKDYTEAWKQAMRGRDYTKFLKMVGDYDSYSETPNAMSSIFKYHGTSMSSPAELFQVFMNSSARKNQVMYGDMSDKVRNWVSHRYRDEAPDIRDAAMWYADLISKSSTGEHLITQQDIDKGRSYIATLNQDIAKAESIGKGADSYREAAKELSAVMDFLESDDALTLKNVQTKRDSTAKGTQMYDFFDELIKNQATGVDLSLQKISSDWQEQVDADLTRKIRAYDNSGAKPPESRQQIWSKIKRNASVTSVENWADNINGLKGTDEKLIYDANGKLVRLESKTGQEYNLDLNNKAYQAKQEAYEILAAAHGKEGYSADTPFTLLGSLMHNTFEQYFDALIQGKQEDIDELWKQNVARYAKQNAFEDFFPGMKDILIDADDRMKLNGKGMFFLQNSPASASWEQRFNAFSGSGGYPGDRSAFKEFLEYMSQKNYKQVAWEGKIIDDRNGQIYDPEAQKEQRRFIHFSDEKDGFASFYDMKGNRIQLTKEEQDKLNGQDKVVRAKPDLVVSYTGADGQTHYGIVDYKSRDTGAEHSLWQSDIYKRIYESLGIYYYENQKELDANGDNFFRQYARFVKQLGTPNAKGEKYESLIDTLIGFDAVTRTAKTISGKELQDLDAVGLPGYLKAVAAKETDYENGYLMGWSKAEQISHQLYDTREKPLTKEQQRSLQHGSISNEFLYQRDQVNHDLEAMEEARQSLGKMRSKYMGFQKMPYNPFRQLQETLNDLLPDDLINEIKDQYGENSNTFKRVSAAQAELNNMRIQLKDTITAAMQVAPTEAIQDMKDAYYGTKQSKALNVISSINSIYNRTAGLASALMMDPEFYQQENGPNQPGGWRITPESTDQNEVARAKRAQMAKQEYEKYKESLEEVTKTRNTLMSNIYNDYQSEQETSMRNALRMPSTLGEMQREAIAKRRTSLLAQMNEYTSTNNELDQQIKNDPVNSILYMAMQRINDEQKEKIEKYLNGEGFSQEEEDIKKRIREQYEHQYKVQRQRYYGQGLLGRSLTTASQQYEASWQTRARLQDEISSMERARQIKEDQVRLLEEDREEAKKNIETSGKSRKEIRQERENIDNAYAPQIESAQKDMQDYAGAIAAAEKQLKSFNSASLICGNVVQNLNAMLESFVTRIGRRLFQKAIQEATSFVKQFNQDMIEIQMITGKSDSEMTAERSKTLTQAKDLSTTVSNVTTVRKALYRQGLFGSDIDERTEDIIKFSTVTGSDITTAMKGLTTALQTGLVSSAEEAMDVLVALGDSAATTAEEISKGMQKAAASAKVAGVSYNELSAMLTIATSKTQLSGSQAGTFFQTLFGRMNRVTKEGYYTDEGGETTNINDVEAALRTAGITLRDASNNFRNSFDVLRDVAKSWNSLNDLQKNNIIYAMVGNRNANMFASLMEGMSEDNGALLDEYLGLAEGASGTTQTKYEIAVEGITAAINRLKTAYDDLIASIGADNFITSILDGATSIIQKFADLNEAGMGLRGVLLALISLTAGASVKSFFGGLLSFLPGGPIISTLASLAASYFSFKGLSSLFATNTDKKTSQDEVFNSVTQNIADKRKTYHETLKSAISDIADITSSYNDMAELSTDKSLALDTAVETLTTAFPDLASSIMGTNASLQDYINLATKASLLVDELVSEDAELVYDRMTLFLQKQIQSTLEYSQGDTLPVRSDLWGKAIIVDDNGEVRQVSSDIYAPSNSIAHIGTSNEERSKYPYAAMLHDKIFVDDFYGEEEVNDYLGLSKAAIKEIHNNPGNRSFDIYARLMGQDGFFEELYEKVLTNPFIPEGLLYATEGIVDQEVETQLAEAINLYLQNPNNVNSSWFMEGIKTYSDLKVAVKKASEGGKSYGGIETLLIGAQEFIDSMFYDDGYLQKQFKQLEKVSAAEKKSKIRSLMTSVDNDGNGLGLVFDLLTDSNATLKNKLIDLFFEQYPTVDEFANYDNLNEFMQMLFKKKGQLNTLFNPLESTNTYSVTSETDPTIGFAFDEFTEVAVDAAMKEWNSKYYNEGRFDEANAFFTSFYDKNGINMSQIKQAAVQNQTGINAYQPISAISQSIIQSSKDKGFIDEYIQLLEKLHESNFVYAAFDTSTWNTPNTSLLLESDKELKEIVDSLTSGDGKYSITSLHDHLIAKVLSSTDLTSYISSLNSQVDTLMSQQAIVDAGVEGVLGNAAYLNAIATTFGTTIENVQENINNYFGLYAQSVNSNMSALESSLIKNISDMVKQAVAENADLDNLSLEDIAAESPAVKQMLNIYGNLFGVKFSRDTQTGKIAITQRPSTSTSNPFSLSENVYTSSELGNAALSLLNGKVDWKTIDKNNPMWAAVAKAYPTLATYLNMSDVQQQSNEGQAMKFDLEYNIAISGYEDLVKLDQITSEIQTLLNNIDQYGFGKEVVSSMNAAAQDIATRARGIRAYQNITSDSSVDLATDYQALYNWLGVDMSSYSAGELVEILGEHVQSETDRMLTYALNAVQYLTGDNRTTFIDQMDDIGLLIEDLVQEDGTIISEASFSNNFSDIEKSFDDALTTSQNASDHMIDFLHAYEHLFAMFDTETGEFKTEDFEDYIRENAALMSVLSGNESFMTALAQGDYTTLLSTIASYIPGLTQRNALTSIPTSTVLSKYYNALLGGDAETLEKLFTPGTGSYISSALETIIPDFGSYTSKVISGQQLTQEEKDAITSAYLSSFVNTPENRDIYNQLISMIAQMYGTKADKRALGSSILSQNASNMNTRYLLGQMNGSYVSENTYEAVASLLGDGWTANLVKKNQDVAKAYLEEMLDTSNDLMKEFFKSQAQNIVGGELNLGEADLSEVSKALRNKGSEAALQLAEWIDSWSLDGIGTEETFTEQYDKLRKNDKENSAYTLFTLARKIKQLDDVSAFDFLKMGESYQSAWLNKHSYSGDQLSALINDEGFRSHFAMYDNGVLDENAYLDYLMNRQTGKALGTDYYGSIMDYLFGEVWRSSNNLSENTWGNARSRYRDSESEGYGLAEELSAFGDAGSNIISVLQDSETSAKDAAQAMHNFQNNFSSKQASEMNQYSQYLSDVESNITGLSKSAKSSLSTVTSMMKTMDNLYNQSRAAFLSQGKTGAQLDSKTRKMMASITGLDEDMIKTYTKEQINGLAAQMQGAADEEFVSGIGETLKAQLASDLQAAFGDGRMTLDQFLSLDILADGEINMEELASLAAQLDSTALATLAAYAGKIGELILKMTVDKDSVTAETILKAFGEVVGGVKGGSGSGYRGGGGGGGGGGKSAADLLLQNLKNRITIQDHRIKMTQLQESKYQSLGELGNVNNMLQVENGYQQELAAVLADNIVQLRNQLTQTAEGSDDWQKLYEAVLEYEEKLDETNNTIAENTKKIKENNQAIRKARTDIEDLVVQEIESRIQTERDMLDGTVEMQNTILDAIKQRYSDEWEIVKKDIEKKRQALEEEKSLISERLQARKDAEDEAKKYEDLAEYQRQLALISRDSTRTREAAELREKIANLESEIAWDLAEDEAEAQQKSIDDQINAMNEYETYGDEDLALLLENANNFSKEVNSVLEMNQSDMFNWMKNNVKEYALSLQEAQEQMVRTWEDTYKQMYHIVDTYWDQVDQILATEDTFWDFMSQSDEYKNASATGKESLKYQWLEDLESGSYAYYLASLQNQATYSHSDAAFANYTGTDGSSSGGSGGGSKASTVETKEEVKVTPKLKLINSKVNDTSNTFYIVDTSVLKKKQDLAAKSYVLSAFDTGGETVGEGIAYLHDKERVLTPDQTRLFDKAFEFLEANRNEIFRLNSDNDIRDTIRQAVAAFKTIGLSDLVPHIAAEAIGEAETNITIGDINISTENLNDHLDIEYLTDQIGKQVARNLRINGTKLSNYAW